MSINDGDIGPAITGDTDGGAKAIGAAVSTLSSVKTGDAGSKRAITGPEIIPSNIVRSDTQPNAITPKAATPNSKA
jgi:hypothetical protein